MEKQENPVKRDLKERIKSITTFDFYVKKCPSDVYERFCKFAINETRDDYAMALKVLLERNDANSIMLTLHQFVIELREEIENIKNILDTKDIEEKESKKTFGKQE